MNKTKITKVLKTNWTKIISILFFVVLLGAYAYTFAIPPATKYSPGEIRDPDCSPGDPNCSVEISSSPWLLNGSDVYYNDGRVGIGTDSPQAMLDIKMDSQINYYQEFYEDDGNGDSLDDATFSGTYTGSNDNLIYVWIDGEGSTDTFSYSDNNGDCPEVNNVPITGSIQDLCLGISIQFGSTTGHSLSDEWDYDISQGLDTVFLVKDYGDNIYFDFNPTSLNFFVGYQAGYDLNNNGVMGVNAIGYQAGYNAIDAFYSNFLGYYAGSGATSARGSNFIGSGAGINAVSAEYSNFIGYASGEEASGASNSNFIGFYSGANATNAHFSNFFGNEAGSGSTDAHSSNFLGNSAGGFAPNASRSNFFGVLAGYGATNASDSNFSGDSAGQYATNASGSNFIGYYAGYLATEANNSNFIGYESGGAYLGHYGATEAYNSNFLGYQAGYSSLYASNSNFLGYKAGYDANLAYRSNFLGYQAGYMANSSYHSNFIGLQAGYQASQANHSNFIGYDAGYVATNAYNSNFFGTGAGFSADNASNSIFIGYSSGEHDNVDNTGNIDDFSILIGKDTNTGGYSNSIAIGGSAVNTASNQFMIGSVTRPINTTIWNTAGGTTCTLISTGLTCTSDEDFKTNIEDLDNDTLSKLLNVKTITYNWKEGDTDTTNIGFLAQDLEDYFPELVSEDVYGNKSVNYANMTPILVEAVRELDLKVKEFSSLDLENSNSLGSLIKDYLSNIENGLEVVFFGEVRTKKLCLDDVCIDKTQLEEILNNINSPDTESSETEELDTVEDDTGEVDTNEGDTTGDTTGDTIITGNDSVSGNDEVVNEEEPAEEIVGDQTNEVEDDDNLSDVLNNQP